MEIRIGVTQAMRELMVEIDDEKAQSKLKSAVEAALAGKTETLSVVDNKGREIVKHSGKIAIAEIGAADGSRKLGFGS